MLGGVLLVASLVVTAILAVRSGAAKPPSPLEAWLLALAAATLQISAGFQFARVGRADPAHARSSVRQLQALGLRAQEARAIAEKAFEQGTAQGRRDALGQLSVYLSEIEEHAVLAIGAWSDFHSDAVAEMIGRKSEEIGEVQ